MSDLIERLRAWEACAKGGPLPSIPAVRNGEAADEIERLGRELAEARTLVATLLDYEGAEGIDEPVRDAAYAFIAGEKP